MKNYTISVNQADRRVDRVIRSFFPHMPMSAIYKNLRTGKFKLNKKRTKPDTQTSAGDILYSFLTDEGEVAQTEKKETGVNLGKIKQSDFFKKNFEILFEDTDVLVLNKPSGVAVHPGTNHKAGRTMTDLAQAYCIGTKTDFAVTLVHRLDIETSGVLLFAKNAKSLRDLNKQMKDHTTEKLYYALVDGRLKKDKGTISLALERTEGHSKTTKIIVSETEDAKKSVTHYKVKQKFAFATLVDVKLETGRMHQIRVHMKSEGHPLWGDGHYGDFDLNKQIKKDFGLKRNFLHAYSLEFTHPTTKEKVLIQSELPEELVEVLRNISTKEKA